MGLLNETETLSAVLAKTERNDKKEYFPHNNPSTFIVTGEWRVALRLWNGYSGGQESCTRANVVLICKVCIILTAGWVFGICANHHW